METATFNVPSISCSICSGKIQEGVKTLKGIGSIDVDLKSQSINIEYNPQEIQSNEIREKISSLGYEVMQ
jgi:Cu+-exporting ATPase